MIPSYRKLVVFALLLLGVVSECITAVTFAERPAFGRRRTACVQRTHRPTPQPLQSRLQVGPHDWPQWGGTSWRNNTPVGKNIPTDWDVGRFNYATGQWLPQTARNIKWVARLGSQGYPTPVIANGKVFIGTNNGAGYIKRWPSTVDLGCLLCFDEQTGKFLWQHSNEKLSTGRVHDWPLQGVVSSPVVSGNRLWYVTNRGEVVCLDTEGFLDGEDDGPYRDEYHNRDDADVVWRFDMMKELDVSQHNMCSCSTTLADGLLFVVTGNGVDESHLHLPSPHAPSFLTMEAHSGKVVWTDNSPGKNILHGQWSSPTYAVLGGVPQVLFPGGDGWLYSFAPRGAGKGRSKLLWKFDCNVKTAHGNAMGRGDINEHITMPVIYDQKVYVAVGRDVEYGEGDGHLWCIDPTKHLDGSDVSPTLANYKFTEAKPEELHRAFMWGVVVSERPNPRSALVWHHRGTDLDGDGQLAFEETMHRTCAPVTIKRGLLFVSDLSGLLHCIDAKQGHAYWTHDLLAATWASAPLVVEDKVYVTDEDGDVTIFKLSKQMEMLSRDSSGQPGPATMGNSIYSSPVVANNVLFIANKTHLFAIEKRPEARKEISAASK